MKHALLRLLAPAALALSASAQIANGTYWTDGNGTTVRVDVTDTGLEGKVSVTLVDATGFTPGVTGTAGDNSTEQNPTAETFPAATTNAPDGEANSYRGRIVDGKPAVQTKNDNGEWVTMTKVKKKKKHQPPGSFEGEDPAAFVSNGRVTFPDRSSGGSGEEDLVPGDEVTSLPTLKRQGAQR